MPLVKSTTAKPAEPEPPKSESKEKPRPVTKYMKLVSLGPIVYDENDPWF